MDDLLICSLHRGQESPNERVKTLWLVLILQYYLLSDHSLTYSRGLSTTSSSSFFLLIMSDPSRVLLNSNKWILTLRILLKFQGFVAYNYGFRESIWYHRNKNVHWDLWLIILNRKCLIVKKGSNKTYKYKDPFDR